MITSRVLLHIISIGFFLGLNIILAAYFLKSVYGYEVIYVRPLVSWLESVQPAVLERSKLGVLTQTAPTQTSERIDISSERVLAQINELRDTENVENLVEDQRLIVTAESLLDWLLEEGVSADQDQLEGVLTESLDDQEYRYELALQTAIFGPYTMQQLSEYWLNSEIQSPLFDESITEVGIAVGISNVDGVVQGITVVVMANEQAEVVANQNVAAPIREARPAIPEVSDDEVVAALNSYRNSHTVPPLDVHPNLCQYAEKRVQDLVANDGLDNHAGFREDFADPSNPPEVIKNYPGRTIGENLAHQLCRNMQTGEGFVASTGVALIEWCFDSSTKGHREAQLSTTYKNVCVRHADGMYVVIFGD
ncbi:MAG: CAP domain-containing protein [Patescibacteria group bacterium]